VSHQRHRKPGVTAECELDPHSDKVMEIRCNHLTGEADYRKNRRSRYITGSSNEASSRRVQEYETIECAGRGLVDHHRYGLGTLLRKDKAKHLESLVKNGFV